MGGASGSEPFTGVDVGAGTTLFYRESSSGIEGFVVGNDELVRTLKERVLDARGLSEVVEMAPATRDGSALSLLDAGRAYEHQFVEPFSAVNATLRLAPLDAPFSEQLLVPITLLLAFAIVLGLWALYRVVATQLEFARRQNNFVAAVSHELKTPLTSIRMHSEMLQEGMVESPEKAQEYYKTITGQAERLSRLIGNVLYLSKIERNRPPEATLGDLVDIVDSAMTALLPHIERSGFSLQFDLPEKVPPVLREPDSVEQILFNLVDNALKYAKDAEDKRLTIAVEVTSQSVSLSVRDRGPGVPEEELERIFEAFYRLEDELTRKSQGTGLGLALVADLASRMKAGLEAKNAHPGMSVTIRFPRQAP